MALASFFDRAKQGAAQVLRDFDPEAFERQVRAASVTVAFDAQAAASPEARNSMDLTVRLLARLYPRLCFIGPDPAIVAELASVACAIHPEIEVVDTYEDGDAETAIVFGLTRYPSRTAIYIGSDRWIGRVSSRNPLGSNNSQNPFGAAAAACLATANVFRTVFANRLAHPRLDEDASLSLLNFATGDEATNGDLPDRTEIASTQLVGVGAIGNAFVWALSRVPDVHGTLDLIDHEQVDLTNLQRYVLARDIDIGASKVAMAAEAFTASDLHVKSFPTTWRDYVMSRGDHRFERVVVALDTARDRVEVQASLPRRIVNAWTQPGDLGISRHGFGGDEACMACLYLPDRQRRNEDQIIADELGLEGPANLMRVREMLYSSALVDESFVYEVAAATGTNVEALLPFIGFPLRSFRQKAVCGSVVLRAPDGGGAEVEVPMAFQSALAGVMAAAEIVAASTGTRKTQPRTKTVVNLMRPLSRSIGSAILARRTGVTRCICGDDDYRSVFDQKYQCERAY